MRIEPIQKLGPLSRVFHVVISDEWDLAMTFLRMQEWYESPKFHHKKFTLEEYMRWYAKAYGKGAFTYPRDWSGFNVPSNAVLAIANLMDEDCPCREPRVGWLASEQALFLKLVQMGLLHSNAGHEPVPGKKHSAFFVPKPFYLIGTLGSEKDTLAHEIAHGRWFVDPIYRNDVLRIMRGFKTKPFEDFLLKKGYSKWTLQDEVHAYTLTGFPDGFKPTASLTDMREALRSMVKR